MTPWYALRELLAILRDAWQAADLRARLRAWAWCVAHAQEL